MAILGFSGLSNWRSAGSQYCFYISLSISRGYIRCSTFNEYRCINIGHLGCGNAGKGPGHLYSRSICRSGSWPYGCRLHWGQHVLEVSVLGIDWLYRILLHPNHLYGARDLRKAKEKRKETSDPQYYAPMEKEKWPLSKRIRHVLVRPWVIFFHEPMLISLTFYMSFVYGCLYLLFEAYPIVFTGAHGFNAGLSGLMLLPVPIGGAFAVVLYIYYYNPQYEAESKRLSPKSVPPEFRLSMTFIAGPLFAISFFWFGWTSFPSVSFWVPLMSGLLMGFSIQLIFLGLFNYLVDAYIAVAASALAATTIVRSLFGAAFPLFGGDMYNVLNPRWASTVLGCIAIALVPIPFVLKRYGPLLRRKSKYCPVDEHDSDDESKSTVVAMEKEETS